MPEAAETLDEAPTLYERDLYSWCYEQARLLRLRRFAEADLPNIVEELESIGREQRLKLTASYRHVVAYLLKWQFRPDKRTSSWEIAILRERAQIDSIERDSSSLAAEARSIIADVYRDARREAEIETGLPALTFPADCPYTSEQIRDDDWLPA